jgi:protease-4
MMEQRMILLFTREFFMRIWNCILFRMPRTMIGSAVLVSVFVFGTAWSQDKPADPSGVAGAATTPSETGSETNAAAQDKGSAEKKTGEEKTSEVKSEAAPPKSTRSESKSRAEKNDNKKHVRVLTLSGNYEDLPSPGSLNPTELIFGGGGKTKSFYRLCDYLGELESEERVTHVVFDLSDVSMAMNPAQLDEIDRRIVRLRSSGKKLIAWLENADNTHLSIASACNEVIMADFGGIDMPSSTMESMFYRDAMDLVGLHASVVRAGDLKGAVEPYTNSVMSAHLKQHYVEMLESINAAQVARIARGRGLTVGAVRELQKKRMLLPAEALSSKLVDRLAPYGTMKQTIMANLGDEYEWSKPKAKPKRDVSIFELMSKAMSPPKDPSKLKDESIAVLHLSGAIQDGKDPSPGAIVSGPTVKLIEELNADDKVKGVVVRINSPGGSATASEAIRQSLDALAKKKPIVFSMGEVAASGGYWITCIGQPILAEHGTITGSIGVFSLKVTLGSLLRRVGVRVETVHLDSSAAMDSIDHAWTDEEIARMQDFIDHTYGQFLKLASESRRMSVDAIKPLAGGRVWSGEQAKQRGLVDNLGGLDDAIAMVAKKLSIEKPKVISRPDAPTGLDLFKFLGGADDEMGDIQIGTTDSVDSVLRSLESQLLGLMTRHGFKADGTKLLFRALAKPESGLPKAWALMSEEIKIR